MRIVTVSGFNPSDMMGGAEHQTLLLAQGLSSSNHDVIFLATNSAGHSEFQTGTLRGVNIPGRRLVGWRRHKQLVARAVREIRPDICYVRYFEELSTIMPLCRQAGVPVVSMSCHAMETSPFLLGSHPREAIGRLRGLNTFFHLRSFLSIRNAAAHVCITKKLRAQIRRWFPRKPLQVIYNGSPVPPPQDSHKESTGQVIWVNNLKRFKRPELFVELARCLPQYRFVMIGRMAGGRYGISLGETLQQAPSNLEYLGSMTIDQVNAAIKDSDLLLYTSLPVEGFGNSFTQAWLRQVPTVSLSFDPDGILEREKIGRYSRDFEQLLTDVKELMEDGSLRRDMGRRARVYAAGHHSAERMVADYAALFDELLPNPAAERALDLSPVESQS